MLDYTKYLNNSFRFILYFEVVDNNIVVHYAKEDDLVIPYSMDTEKFLLILMRNQVLSFYDTYLQLCKQYNNFDNSFSNVISVMSLIYSVVEQNVLAFLFATLFWGKGVWNKRNHVKLKELIDDYEKNKFFVDNEDKFRDFGIDISINDLDSYSKSQLISMLYKTDDSLKLRNNQY